MSKAKPKYVRKLPHATIEELEQEIVYLGSVIYGQRQRIRELEKDRQFLLDLLRAETLPGGRV